MKGFTLAELLIALATPGIIVAFAIPKVHTAMKLPSPLKSLETAQCS